MAGHFRENFEVLGDWLRGRAGKWIAIIAIVLAVPVALVFMAPIVLGWFAPPLDTSKDLYAINRPIAFTFLDAAGKEVGHRGAVVGARLTLDEMPAYLPAAFVSMEDRRFYEHSGFDVRGLIRAMWTNFQAGHLVQGGSTITQQTAKIIFTSQERTFGRKLSEAVEAASLEKSLSKKQILELYLNRIYLGSGAYGVDGASRVYFGTSAKHVTLAQAAMLATLTRAPSVFSPRRDLAAAQQRANIVLDAMVETGAITQAQADDAKAHPAVITSTTVVDARNFYLDTAADEAVKMTSVDGVPPSGDLTVHTMLDPHLNEAARGSLDRTLAARGGKVHATEGAVVVMKLDGAVVALIGGRDYDASVFNRAIQAKRQPGSAFKPFVYLAALEGGATPWDTRDGGAVDINGWTPTNFGGREYGTLTLADALAHSVNTITASLAQEVGLTTVVEVAKRCGITSDLVPNASLALGTSEVSPLELTTAYTTFANGGVRVEPYFVTEVDDARGRVLYKRNPPQPQRVIASHVDRDLLAMMYGVMTEGTGRGAAIAGHQAAGKTGTTQDYHDAWFVGFTTDYVTGVWVGNDDSSPMKNVTGGTLPAAIWKATMTVAEKGLPAKPLQMSPQQPPNTDEEDSLFASGDNSSGDDESSYGNSNAGGDDETTSSGDSGADYRQPQQRRGFWNWLFGSGGDNSQGQQQAAPQGPPAVPPQAQQYPQSAQPQQQYPQQYPQQQPRQYPPQYGPQNPQSGPYQPYNQYPNRQPPVQPPPPQQVQRIAPPPPPPNNNGDDESGDDNSDDNGDSPQ